MSKDLEKTMENIDIGGTPSNILGKTKKNFAYSLGYQTNNLMIILDPFNLARIERYLPIGDNYKIKQIKFSVNVPEGNTDLSSEAVSAPDPEKIKQDLIIAKPKILGKIIGDYGWKITDKKELERRYNQLIQEIPDIANNSLNLRQFMNSLVKKFTGQINTILLEDLFSKNPNITYDLMKKFKIPARAICPECNTFQNIILGEDLSCCNVPSDIIIKSGRFIPEEGFFPVLTYLNGYKTFTPKGREYIQNAQKILNKMEIPNDTVAVEYDDPEKQLTAIEFYLLDGILKK